MSIKIWKWRNEEKIEYYKGILNSTQKVLELIKEELQTLIEQHGDDRRSEVIIGEDEDMDIEDLIEETTQVVTFLILRLASNQKIYKDKSAQKY